MLLGHVYNGIYAARIMVGPGFSGGPVYSEDRKCMAGVTIRSNMDSAEPVMKFVRPTASAGIMRVLRAVAPESVKGL